MAGKADQLKRVISTLILRGGSWSLAGSIKPDRLDAIVQRMDAEGVDPKDTAVHSWLNMFRGKHQSNFYTDAENEKRIQRERSEANAPRPRASDSDVTQGALRSMTAVQRLEFINRKSGYPKPTIYTIKDENIVTENE